MSSSILTEKLLVQMDSYMQGYSMGKLIAVAGKHFKFPMRYESPEMNVSIDELEINLRARNCLHRKGWHTVGDIVRNIERTEDLLKIKGMGKLTAQNVMECLFAYQFTCLSETGRRKYMNRLLEVNGIEDIRKEIEQCLTKVKSNT